VPYAGTVKSIDQSTTKKGSPYWRIVVVNAKGDWGLVSFKKPSFREGDSIQFEAKKNQNGGWVLETATVAKNEAPRTGSQKSPREQALITASALVKSLIEAGKSPIGKDLDEALAGLAAATQYIEHLITAEPREDEHLDDYVFEEQ